MNHQLSLYLSLFIVLTFVLASFGKNEGVTASAIVSDQMKEARAFLLNDKVSSFFTTGGVIFPPGVCGEVAKSMYRDIAFSPVDVIAGFTSQGNQRIASMNFVIDRIRRYGTLDMVRGRELLANYGVDGMISFNVESVVTVPKEQRTNFFSMDLLGYIDNFFYVHRGGFSTPSFDCTFVTSDKNTECNCVAHSISGIEVAGITSVPQIRDYFSTITDLTKEKKFSIT